MNFNEKLQHLRASRKLSQEELAGRLDVSRQAVTKWENGQAFPDFPNLVRLSELFGVSIDRLVRQEEECAPALLDPDPASEKALRRFLMRAKKRTYASGQNTAPPSRPQSHDFQYSEQDYLYIDTYLGSRNFTGEEAVWIRDTPIWALNYYGVSLDETFYSAFLKEASPPRPGILPERGFYLCLPDTGYPHPISGGRGHLLPGGQNLYVFLPRRQTFLSQFSGFSRKRVF